MPPRGYRHLSLREEVYRRLEEVARELGMTSLNNVIAHLLDKYRVCVNILEKLEKHINKPSCEEN